MKKSFTKPTKLPSGEQNFKKFHQANYIYVDKTALIYEIIEEPNYYFLSRPRRFGKSLLLDTMAEIFKGNKHLFENTWIYDKIDWEAYKYPVLQIDFSAFYSARIDFVSLLNGHLKDIEKTYDLAISPLNLADYFAKLIKGIALKTGKQVVILIDEYDKPITEHIDNFEKADKNRIILKEFYSGLKAATKHIRLLFITGITKYAKVSLFSVINHITDLTFTAKFATLVGITEQELRAYFGDFLEAARQKLGYESLNNLLAVMKNEYNGYSWDGEHFVYNPFTLLHFLRNLDFGNYWFDTGVPELLVKALKKVQVERLHKKLVAATQGTTILSAEQDISVERVRKIVVDELFFSSLKVSKTIQLFPLLFQTGYMTIKSIRRTRPKRGRPRKKYTLGYPNLEVEAAFTHHLAGVYANLDAVGLGDIVNGLENAVLDKDMESLHKYLHLLFADLPYPFSPRQSKKGAEIFGRAEHQVLVWEGYFQTVIYLTLRFLGFHIDCEVSKNKGRLDAIIKTDKYVYIIEFKLDNAKAALQQIKDNSYKDAFVDVPQEVILVGIAFDKKKRNVKPIKWEVWDKKLS